MQFKSILTEHHREYQKPEEWMQQNLVTHPEIEIYVY